MGQRPYGSKEQSTGAEGAVTQDLTRSTIFAARDAEHFRARPPGVVSGLPYITPIFSRIWFVKFTDVFERLTAPVSLRSAWLINRA